MRDDTNRVDKAGISTPGTSQDADDLCQETPRSDISTPSALPKAPPAPIGAADTPESTAAPVRTSSFGFLYRKVASYGNDALAAVVIAALTIPLALGYAEIAGVPARYGLYASIVATLVYALISRTRHVIFGMDSATSAVVGSAVLGLGITLGSSEAVDAMVFITLSAGAFLVVFSLLGAGRIADFVPVPVLHGFILGISILIILHQLPALFGTSVTFTGNIAVDLVNISRAIPPETPWAFYISCACLLLLIMAHRLSPSMPMTIIVLVGASIAAAIMAGMGMQVPCIEVAGDLGVPKLHIVSLTGQDPSYMLKLVWAGLMVALVSGIESILCLDMFSKAEPETDINRELMHFGIADAISAIFGCPTSSASVSRTAANIGSGGKSKAAAILSAIIILVLVMFASGLLAFVPRCALASIVIVAMATVIDYPRIRSYYQHMLPELFVLCASAAIVLALGAVYGVMGGALLSVLVHLYRLHAKGEGIEMGIAATKKGKRKIAEGEEHILQRTGASSTKSYLLKCPTCAFAGDLTFYNVPRKIARFATELESRRERDYPVIIDISGVVSIDSSATDAILHLIDRLLQGGWKVKLVRSVGITTDDETRFEISRILEKAKIYPSRTAAVSGVKQKHFRLVEGNETTGAGPLSGKH